MWQGEKVLATDYNNRLANPQSVNSAFDGAADAAAWVAVIAILMQLYPDKVATIISWTEMVFGLGYAVGKTRIIYVRKLY